MPARSHPRRSWTRLPDHKLLALRMCDLDLVLERSPVWPRIERLYRELERKHLVFRPHCWISDEWYTPDGVPGIAIPFYLVHPRLAELERSQMREVEGGTVEWCMRILRHETGHAIENAYRLRRRHRRQQLFGKTSQPYPQHYAPKPYSKRYVLHLEAYYAQSHPDEDFAETFAVWLTPRSSWRRRYAGWPALKKLQYVDELMAEIAGQKPLVMRRLRVEPLSQLTQTLAEHYEKKQANHAIDYPKIYDRDLRRLFSADPRHRRSPAASAFLRRNRAKIRQLVSKWTGEYELTLDSVFDDMIGRCRELKLRAVGSERQLRMEFIVLLTAKTVHSLYSPSRRQWLAL